MAIRAVIADGEPVYREGLRHMLDQAEGIEVVGEAGSADDICLLSRSLQPDVLVLGPKLESEDVAAVVARVHAETPGIQVLMMGADDPAKAQEALAGGAVGYVVENAARELLIEAVRAVARGGVWLSESVADGLFGGVQTAPGERGEGLLTARERDVLRLIARGHDNEAISRDLCLGRQTVRNYVSRIYGKLGVRYRGEVIVWAREHGFGSE